MNALAARYAEHDVGSIFIYTHEAHPAEHYPHLTSMEQKVAHAAALRDVYGVTRPILLDSLDGACHRAYGSMPNMTWIFNRSGRPLYKAPWTDAHSLENAIAYYVDVLKRRRAGERLAPVKVERVDYRTVNTDGFFAGLERNGPRAVREFQQAIGIPGQPD